MTQSGPLRRQLTTELKKLRNQAKLTQQHVAKTLDWSHSKVMRIEKGEVKVQQTDLDALLRLYAVNDEQVIDDLRSMALGSKKLPLTEYRGVVSEETLRYFQLEVGASIIRQVALNVVPGLLQTDDYARAIFAAYHVDRVKADTLLASRRERRELLERPDPPEIFVIIDEAALRRSVGGEQVMANQIEHLVAMARRPTVSIQVLPFALGAHAALLGSFNHLEFPAGDNPETIYVENALGDALFEDNAEVTESYRKRFQELEKAATPTADFEKFAMP